MAVSGTPGHWWEDEGGRIAGRLGDVTSIVVAGASADHSARVAIGIAMAESTRRRVALGDLTGEVTPLYEVAGGEDAFGLTDCLRQGLPLNDIARPAPGRDTLFILPAGSPPVACTEILAHERWPRLVNGFASAGALLVLVAPLEASGFDVLAAAVEGVVLVDAVEGGVGGGRVVASVARGRDESELESESRGESRGEKRGENRGEGRSERGEGSGRRLRGVMIGALVLAVALGGWSARGAIAAAVRAVVARVRPRTSRVSDGAPRAAGGNSAGAPDGSSARATAATRLSADTVVLTDPVNPADTADTAPFAVEVMAANTLAGANSFLAEHARSASFGVATVSPVTAGGAANVWYAVVVGAAHDRAGAESLRSALRHEGVLRQDAGRVAEVPYALLLAEVGDGARAAEIRQSFERRGFSPYLLVQRNGTIRVMTGAFATPAQAAPLAAAMRAAGVVAVLAFRTGRAN